LATRVAGDREKIALFLLPLEETAAFASAAARGREEAALDGQRSPPEDATAEGATPQEATTCRYVTAADVEHAWTERRVRHGAAERRVREMTLRHQVALDTDGARVGVVNGLSVYSAGDVEFGQPMRITAVVAIGREGIIDVEREAQLGCSAKSDRSA
jgi:predicted ATP-dependent protease